MGSICQMQMSAFAAGRAGWTARPSGQAPGQHASAKTDKGTIGTKRNIIYCVFTHFEVCTLVANDLARLDPPRQEAAASLSAMRIRKHVRAERTSANFVRNK